MFMKLTPLREKIEIVRDLPTGAVSSHLKDLAWMRAKGSRFLTCFCKNAFQHTLAHTHTRTHTRTHARTHARTHITHTHWKKIIQSNKLRVGGDKNEGPIQSPENN